MVLIYHYNFWNFIFYELKKIKTTFIFGIYKISKKHFNHEYLRILEKPKFFRKPIFLKIKNFIVLRKIINFISNP